VNTSVPAPEVMLGWEPGVLWWRVLRIQRKLHRWAGDDPGRRFDDVFNLVCDPAVLVLAWQRVRANRGARSAGVDGESAYYVETVRGVQPFLSELRRDLKAGMFRPSPVREVMIPTGPTRSGSPKSWSGA